MPRRCFLHLTVALLQGLFQLPFDLGQLVHLLLNGGQLLLDQVADVRAGFDLVILNEDEFSNFSQGKADGLRLLNEA